MNTLDRLATLSALAALAVSVAGSLIATPSIAAPVASRNGATLPKARLAAFTSEEELASLLKKWQEARKKHEAENRNKMMMYSMADSASKAGVTGVAPAAAPAPTAAAKSGSDAKAEESVTNNQTVGVDEGGIVKLHGTHLVVLRRGRLFTISTAGDMLKPVAALDAFGPDIDPGGAWYDEMLISGNTIVVIGYSYARGGTEIGLFSIDDAGGLTYRATYHLRSNDYYSSRNYASRLIGSKLVFYTPLYLNVWARDLYESFPAYRKWQGRNKTGEFRRIAPATRIYRTDEELDPLQGVALHSVMVCDLARTEMDCKATAVLGPAGRVFYVSAESVYVWTTSTQRGDKENRPRSAVFRIPLDGGAPSALKTAGSPIDQFSFLESGDGHLNVLLRAQGRGEAMWASERSTGSTALLRVPLSSFGDGRESALPEHYRNLPSPEGHTLQNRYVGPWLLYGAGASWGQPKNRNASLYALRWTDPPKETVQELTLHHGIDRIEALGAHALVVGGNGADLHFSSLQLEGRASLAGSYVQANAAQGETRSHGFFYKPTSPTDGLLGLPVRTGGEPGYKQLQEESAAVLFLRNRHLRLTELGSLASRPDTGQDDGCRASCVDWYGNSRPLFLGERIFALMGYELVEGKLASTAFRPPHIRETRRITFAPQTRQTPAIVKPD